MIPEPTKDNKTRIKSGQYRRQALFSESDKTMFIQEARKDAIGRFSEIVKKYNISQEDVEEIIDISQFLI